MAYGINDYERIQDSRWYLSREEIGRHENQKFICPQSRLLNVLEEYLNWYGDDIETQMKNIRYDLKHILDVPMALKVKR
jgi:hypothetical protein